MSTLLTFAFLLSGILPSQLTSIFDNYTNNYSVEINLAEMSPLGKSGGLAVPASGASSFIGQWTKPNLPECSDGIDNDGDGTRDHAGFNHTIWITTGTSRSACSAVCNNFTLPNPYGNPAPLNAGSDPLGRSCASGEINVNDALNQHGTNGWAVYPFGCGSGGCGVDYQGPTQQYHITDEECRWNPNTSGDHGKWDCRDVDMGYYCYPSGNPEDDDDSDISTACACNLPWDIAAIAHDPGCDSPQDDDETNPPPGPAVKLEVRNVSIGGNWTINDIVISPTDQIELRWISQETDSCTGVNFITGAGDPTNGTQSSVNEPSAGTTRNYRVNCTRGTTTAYDSLNVTAIQGGTPPEVTSEPPYVRPEEEAEINWNTRGNDPATCTLTGNGLNLNPLSSVTGSATVTIYNESVYTLTCPGGIDQTTIRVLPEIQET